MVALLGPFRITRPCVTEIWYNIRSGKDKAYTVRRGGLRSVQEKERLVRGPHREDTRSGADRVRDFLRPRRFGKSLLTSILEAYYDLQYADRFDEFFAGTDIGADPTEERGSYLVLRFDFASVAKEADKVQSDFDYKAALQCDTFARRYRDVITGELADRILSAPDSGKKLAQIYLGLKGTGHKLYVIIDEYDNFTNTILAESGEKAYNELCHGDGFFKQFFTELKSATTGTEAPVSRLFITGVSPVTMDDVTSGFNIGTNISLWPQFTDLTGFRHDDIRAMAQYYAATATVPSPCTASCSCSMAATAC